ncbi:MAG: SynChlorMet cassette radical SAM/SPASM protein ScmF [Methanotrichaceae archaeon]|nr:SynChlorMet cassette radical SAM/SPASM protein ScmF [Methanotrichaceae archaeon]
MCKELNSDKVVPPLNMLYFYLTDDCNLACRHCWIAPKFNPQGDKSHSLPIELFEEAIKEAKPLGLTSLKLTGGEPLLHPQFTKLLQIVRREKLSLNIETNGLLCTPDMAAEIAESTISCIAVSIDGTDPETHESIRGVPGSFEKATLAVRNLVSVGIRPQIIMTVMRRNIDQIDEMAFLAKKLGASSVKYNIVQPTARGEMLFKKGEVVDVAGLVNLSKHVEEELSRDAKMRLIFDVPVVFRSLGSIFGKGNSGVCRIQSIMGVLANGKYALCGIGINVPELIFGTVGIDKLEDVWQNNEILNDLRSGLPKRLTGICAKCIMKHMCLGSCVAQNFYLTKNIWSSHWFCQQADDIGIFPETRIALEI